MLSTSVIMDETEKQDFTSKWNNIQEAMLLQGADGCLLSIDVNLYYTCGYIFNGYFYLPATGTPFFFTKNENPLPYEKVYPIRKPEQLPELFQKTGIPMPRKLLLEADELSYNEYMRLAHIFKPGNNANATTLLRQLRMIKTPWEIGQMKLSAQAHIRTYSMIPRCYRKGMTDLELQFEIEYRMRQNGSIGLFKAFGNNMDIFMGSILAGNNAENPSPFDFALGGSGMNTYAPLGANGTLLQEGMTVMVDMSGNYTAYQTDMTRVFAIGKIPEKAYFAHQISRDIQEKILQTAQPGTACCKLYDMAHQLADQAGLSAYFMGTRQQARFVGHGVGLQINELPVLTPRSQDVLKPGMTFALEPKFVIPGTGAVGIENTFLVTEKGLENLTEFSEEIQQLG